MMSSYTASTLSTIQWIWNHFVLSFKDLYLTGKDSRSKASEQKPPPPFLELPVDILFYIYSSFIARADRVCLAYTCRALHATTGLPNPPLSREETHEVAQRLQLDRLECWYCRHCCTSHNVSHTDTPSHPERSQGCSAAVVEQDVFTPLDIFHLRHRHINQALKYWASKYVAGVQLSAKQEQHLKAILDFQASIPSMSLQSRQDLSSEPKPWVVFAHCEVPKIVDNRFMLMSVWICFGTRPTLVPTYRRLRIYKHQFSYQAPMFLDLESLSAASPARSPDEALPTSADLSPADAPYWHPELSRAEVTALTEQTGQEILGSCPLCPTDFAVKHLSYGRTAYCSWKDLEYAAEVEGSDNRRALDCNSTGKWGRWHEEGSVRLLYHRTPCASFNGVPTLAQITRDLDKRGLSPKAVRQMCPIQGKWQDSMDNMTDAPQMEHLRAWMEVISYEMFGRA